MVWGSDVAVYSVFIHFLKNKSSPFWDQGGMEIKNNRTEEEFGNLSHHWGSAALAAVCPRPMRGLPARHTCLASGRVGVNGTQINTLIYRHFYNRETSLWERMSFMHLQSPKGYC